MPGQANLQALPPVVVIDLEAGKTTGSAQVEYAKESEDAIWQRWLPGAWQPVLIPISGMTDPALVHGYFATPQLKPGLVYQAGIWERGVDPNQLPTNVDFPVRAKAELMVYALRKRPEQRDFLDSQDETTGGTYHQHYVIAKSPVRAHVAISTAPPVADADGLPAFSAPLAQKSEPPKQSFALLLPDLVPGTFYYELVRLSDEWGNWQFLQSSFTTLKRRIRVRLSNIHVNDDSDELSNGEAAFTFDVEVGNPKLSSQWTTRDTLTYANSNIETGKDVSPAPTEECTIGPEPATPGSVSVRLRASADEDDFGSPFQDSMKDHAWGMKDLWMPSGTMDESVVDRTETIVAGPGDHDFKFTTTFRYWIEYL